jgi:hypothetical protein
MDIYYDIIYRCIYVTCAVVFVCARARMDRRRCRS